MKKKCFQQFLQDGYVEAIVAFNITYEKLNINGIKSVHDLVDYLELIFTRKSQTKFGASYFSEQNVS